MWAPQFQVDQLIALQFSLLSPTSSQSQEVVSPRQNHHYAGFFCSQLLPPFLTKVPFAVAITVDIHSHFHYDKTLFPDAPGSGSMPSIWKQLHQFLAKPDNCHFPSDLAGFFNAVPRADIISSVQWLVCQYQETTGHEVLSIHLASKKKPP